jgi:hypothetical protein
MRSSIKYEFTVDKKYTVKERDIKNTVALLTTSPSKVPQIFTHFDIIAIDFPVPTFS